jgi:hypothetical protein
MSVRRRHYRSISGGGRSTAFPRTDPGEVEDLPLLFVNSGQVNVQFAPDGSVVGIEQVGRVEDVCAALA